MTNTEINEAVARKLGKIICDEGGVTHTKGEGIEEGLCMDFNDYCTSIAAAFELPGIESLIRLESGRWCARFGGGSSNNTYYEVGIYDDGDNDKDSNCAFADIAPMAICLAFLKVP